MGSVRKISKPQVTFSSARLHLRGLHLNFSAWLPLKSDVFEFPPSFVVEPLNRASYLDLLGLVIEYQIGKIMSSIFFSL